MRLRFGAFTFDSPLRQLARNGEPVEVTPKAFLLLEKLIEAGPEPVSREAIYEMLWADTFVEPGNLHNLISELRAALGDRNHETIRTVHRFGYAFTASGIQEAVSRYAVVLGDDEILLREGDNGIGRDPADVIVINTPEVSRHHARIIVNGGGATVEDLGSKNGTFVGGERISSRTAIRQGDVILVGKTLMRIRELAASLPSTRTAT